jgi:lysophospholipase L1-like esterase
MSEPPADASPEAGGPRAGAAPRRLVRVLAAAWIAFAAVAVLALAGELWLRVDHRRSLAVAERVGKGNVFFAHMAHMNAGDHSLWAERWSRYRPGAKAELEVDGERFRVEINSEGYRTREFARPKPAGLLRVACIGGSTTVAGRTNEETYPALLEAALRARHPGLGVEVLNLGVSGINNEHWLARLDEVLAFEPDLLVHYEAINDISWRQLPRFAEAHPWRKLAYRSLLLERLFPLPVEALDPYLDDTLRSLGDIAGRCRERGVLFLAGSFSGPDPERLDDETRRHLDVSAEFWFRRFPMRSYATWARILARYNPRFEAFARERHFPHALVHERLADPRLYVDVCHFTPKGIGLLADAFLPEVDALLRSTPEYRRWAGSSRPAL